MLAEAYSRSRRAAASRSSRAKSHLQDERDEEGGRADAEKARSHEQAIEPRAAPHGGDHAGAHAEEELNEDPGYGEQKGPRHPRCDDVDHGLAHLEALTEVDVQRRPTQRQQDRAARVAAPSVARGPT